METNYYDKFIAEAARKFVEANEIKWAIKEYIELKELVKAEKMGTNPNQNGK